MLVDRSRAVFATDPLPHLIVTDPPHMDALPPLVVREGYIERCEGWQLAARVTFSVVDGPGDAGFMVPGATSAEELEQLIPWLEAVDEAGAAVVIALDHVPENQALEALVSLPNARGGVIPFLPPSE